MSDLASMAKLGIIFGLILGVGGAVAMMWGVCTYSWEDGCLVWEYPYKTAGIAGLVLGIVILVLSVVVLLFSYKQATDIQQVFSVGSPCPICNRPMVWIPQHERWFCQSCQKYG
jgi:hypothetical protein